MTDLRTHAPDESSADERESEVEDAFYRLEREGRTRLARLGALGWSVLGNVIGGVGLVTFLRLIRVPGQLAEERHRSGRRHGTGGRRQAGEAADSSPLHVRR